MSKKIHIVIDVPFEYNDRDRLTEFLGAKFPEAEISVVHKEVSKPEVVEAMIEYDTSAQPAETAEAIADEDSRSIMQKVEEALSQFTGGPAATG
jgi:hypothetical protein